MQRWCTIPAGTLNFDRLTIGKLVTPCKTPQIRSMYRMKGTCGGFRGEGGAGGERKKCGHLVSRLAARDHNSVSGQGFPTT